MSIPSRKLQLDGCLDDSLVWLTNNSIQPCVALCGTQALRENFHQHCNFDQVKVIECEHNDTFVEHTIDSDDECSDIDVAPEEPMGIIGPNWFSNRMYFVPAVSVLIFEWPVEISFEELKREVVGKVKTFKLNNSSRDLHPMVAILKISSAPLEDDILLERQLMSLRSDLSLSEDYLVLIPSFRLAQVVQSVGLQIKDNAVAVYGTAVKTLKRKRSRLSRNSPINTLIRYHIKLGFYEMLIHDNHSALRCFTTAHQDLCGKAPVTTFELIEIRSIGLVLNALICQILTLSEDIPGVLDQFERHIKSTMPITVNDNYSKQLHFMLEKWIQQEYGVMALLLRDYPPQCFRFLFSSGNAAVRRVEHPLGLHDLEKHYVEQLLELSHKPPFFYGQVPRYDQFELDNGIAADLFMLLESQYRRSPNILTLMTAAHNLLLSLPKRRKRQVAISESRIARQLVRESKFSAALPLFQKILQTLRDGSWADCLISTLRAALVAAIEIKSFSDAIKFQCELIAVLPEGQSMTLHKEFLALAKQASGVVDLSSTGILSAFQANSVLTIFSKFPSSVSFKRITVFDASETESCLACSDLTISKSSPLSLDLSMSGASFAIFSLESVSLRIEIARTSQIAHVLQEVSCSLQSAVTSCVAYEYVPITFALTHFKGYSRYTLSCSMSKCLLDSSTLEPVGDGRSLAIDQTCSLERETFSISAILYCTSPGSVNVVVALFGDERDPFEHVSTFTVQDPFQISVSWMSYSLEKAENKSDDSSLIANSPSLVHLQLCNAATFKISVVEVIFAVNLDIFPTSAPVANISKELSPNDAVTCCFSVIPTGICISQRPGQILVKWRRCADATLQTFVSNAIPVVTVYSRMLSVDMIYPDPDTCVLGKPFILGVNITSRLYLSTKINVLVDVARSSFHLSGPIKSSVFVPIGGQLLLQWTLYPLKTGTVQLPHIRLSTESNPSLLDPDALVTVFVRSCEVS
uniref:Trafficking protein particle complex subunit 11 domain-containing protein n=1 Tax=Spongospora subterranea TaxID=70186 RepID=A0A0H5RPM4_9EUKA|eukprot:CRZ10674.1 hypothetical protein [Spongospora subterranea]